MDPFSVLILEDNYIFRRALREILLSLFPCAAIEESADGRDAMEKVRKSRPTLIFMDIKLPGENGLEITRKIKAQYPDIIVAVLTSYDLPEYREAAIRYGADHFMIKGSSTFEEISSLVTKVVTFREGHLPCA